MDISFSTGQGGPLGQENSEREGLVKTSVLEMNHCRYPTANQTNDKAVPVRTIS